MAMRNWQWWKLYTRVKPLLSVARQEDEMKKMAEEFEKTKEELAKTQKLKKELEEQNVTLLQAKNDLFLQLQAEQDNISDLEERIQQLVNQKGDYEEQVSVESQPNDFQRCAIKFRLISAYFNKFDF